jgi:hypothetical protein
LDFGQGLRAALVGADGPVALPRGTKSMTNPNDPNTEPNELWIASAAILLLILAAMGINMLISHNTSTGSETSNQSATVPPK